MIYPAAATTLRQSICLAFVKDITAVMFPERPLPEKERHACLVGDSWQRIGDGRFTLIADQQCPSVQLIAMRESRSILVENAASIYTFLGTFFSRAQSRKNGETRGHGDWI